MSREYLTCLPQRHNSKPVLSVRYLVKQVGTPSIPRSFRLVSTRASPLKSDVPAKESSLSGPLSYFPKIREQNSFADPVGDGPTRPYFFPKVSSKAVAYWLLGSAASVFGIVVFGGLTRLTESGCVMNLTKLHC